MEQLFAMKEAQKYILNSYIDIEILNRFNINIYLFIRGRVKLKLVMYEEIKIVIVTKSK